jgi:hypothetical protein
MLISPRAEMRSFDSRAASQSEAARPLRMTFFFDGVIYSYAILAESSRGMVPASSRTVPPNIRVSPR